MKQTIITIIALIILIISVLWLVQKEECPRGYWSAENHCSTLCEGHNHSIEIDWISEKEYICKCKEGEILAERVCV